MTHLLNAMEIIKKSKNKTSYVPKINPDYSLFKELLFYYQQKTSFPKELIYYILQYSIAIKNKDLLNTTIPFITQWRYYHIPMVYFYLLTPEQTDLIKALFSSRRIIIVDKYKYKEHCILKSNKDYNLFLTLPTQLRTYLTQLPSSITTKICKIPAQTILVRNQLPPIIHNKQDTLRQYNLITDDFSFGYIHKPIFPENKIDITKTNNNQEKHKKNNYLHTTIQELCLTRIICQEKNIPQIVTNHLLQTYIMLKNKDLFNNTKTSIIKYHNFNIPRLSTIIIHTSMKKCNQSINTNFAGYTPKPIVQEETKLTITNKKD
jgi:hypothetical protein